MKQTMGMQSQAPRPYWREREETVTTQLPQRKVAFTSYISRQELHILKRGSPSSVMKLVDTVVT